MIDDLEVRTGEPGEIDRILHFIYDSANSVGGVGEGHVSGSGDLDIAESILESLEEPFPLGDQEGRISASIGIAYSTHRRRRMEKAAAAAMSD